MISLVVSFSSEAKAARIFGVGGGIHGAGGIVKNQHFGVLEQGAGNAEPLLLSAGDVDAALAQIRVQAVRHPLQELVGAGGTAGSPELFVRSVGARPRGGSPGWCRRTVYFFSQHHTDLVSQMFHGVICHRAATHGDSSSVASYSLGIRGHQRGLGAAGTAQDAHSLAGADVQIHVPENPLRGSGDRT